MSIVNREKFLQGLAKSGILGSDAIKKWLLTVAPETDSKDLARDLLSKKLLTRWQAKMLLRGAWRLRFGNYLLTDRIDRTEFGDRFSAIHQQLSRDVFIQYLPTEFSDSRESRKKIFSLGSKLSELDHPNLVHVYDVDEERERVYLVSEVAQGQDLQELLAGSETHSSAAIARIVRGCLKGVRYAHSKEVVFGSISNDTIVVGPDGEPKICGLTKFAVGNELAESPALASEDLAAVNEISASLLGVVSESERGLEGFPKLQAAVSSVETDPDAAIAALDELVRVEVDSSLGGNDIKLAPETPRLAATAHPAAALVQPVASGHAEDTEAVEFEESEGFLTAMARRNPVALIAASAVMALMLIGGTVFAASKLVTKPAAVADGESVAKVNDAGKQASTKKKRRSKGNKASKVDRPDFRNKRGALSTDAPEPTPLVVTDPNANLAAIDAIFNKTKEKDTSTAPVEVVNMTPAKEAAKEQPETSPEPATPEAAKPAEAPKTEVASTPAQQSPQKAKATPAKQDKQEPEYLAEGADPFKDFVTVVDLPDIGSTEQVSFGKLILEKRHLLGAELLSTPSSHRSKPIFEMARSSDDKQTWDITFRKKKKTPPVIVAKLQKTPNQLKFNWLPEAGEIEVANYLRNCRIKISTATHSHWLTLRKPFKIDGFAFAKDKGQVQVDCEIPFMPNPIALAASAGGIKFERMDKDDYKQKAHLEPAEITPNAPSRTYFHEDKDRFLSLDVGIKVRKKEKLTLQAALVIQPEDQPPVILENPQAIGQVGSQIRQAAKQAQQVAKQAKQLKDQKKMKWDEEKAYADAARKATDQAELTKYYEHVVPQLVEKEIPVTIVYTLNEQHRIILAHTAETAETKKK